MSVRHAFMRSRSCSRLRDQRRADLAGRRSASRAAGIEVGAARGCAAARLRGELGQRVSRRQRLRSAWPARSGVNSVCGSTDRAAGLAPARARWRSGGRRVACGSGTRIAGRPTAVSSAIVEAPARAMTRCASARRAGMSAKKVAQLGRDRQLAHRPSRTASISSGAACWITCSRARSAGGSSASAAGTTSAQHARALAAAGDEQAEAARPASSGG